MKSFECTLVQSVSALSLVRLHDTWASWASTHIQYIESEWAAVSEQHLSCVFCQEEDQSQSMCFSACICLWFLQSLQSLNHSWTIYSPFLFLWLLLSLVLFSLKMKASCYLFGNVHMATVRLYRSSKCLKPHRKSGIKIKFQDFKTKKSYHEEEIFQLLLYFLGY